MTPDGPAVSLRITDMIAIVLYAVGMLALGWWAKNRIKGTEGYYVGGRAIPGWAVGISMLGTAISSVTFLAYPGSSYSGNWSRLIPGLMLPITTLIAVWFFVVFYRRTLFVSAYQYFEERFGNWGRSYASFMWSIMSIYRMGSILYLMALPIKLFTGWSVGTVVIVAGIVITIYTMMGGLEAVIWTDVVQTIVLAMGGILSVLIVFLHLPGGVGEVFSTAVAAEKFDLIVSFDLDFTEAVFVVFALSGLVGNVQEFATDQTKIQRYAAARSDRAALGATWTVGLGCIPLWSLFMFVGTCMWVFYQHNVDLLPEGIRADNVYPHFIMTELPPFIGGIVISAVLAAAMSSIDSSMNCAATVLTTDFYKRHMVTDRDDRHYLTVARIVTTVLGVLMMFVAYGLYMLGEGAILDTLFFIGSVMAAGLGGFFLLGFVSKRVNSKGAAVGLIVGILSIAWNTISYLIIKRMEAAGADPTITLPGWYTTVEPYLWHIHPFMINVIGNFVVFGVGIVASYFFAAPDWRHVAGMTWRTRNEPRESHSS